MSRNSEVEPIKNRLTKEISEKLGSDRVKKHSRLSLYTVDDRLRLYLVISMSPGYSGNSPVYWFGLAENAVSNFEENLKLNEYKDYFIFACCYDEKNDEEGRMYFIPASFVLSGNIRIRKNEKYRTQMIHIKKADGQWIIQEDDLKNDLTEFLVPNWDIAAKLNSLLEPSDKNEFKQREMIQIKNGKILTPRGVIENGSVLIEGVKIKAVGKFSDVENAEIIDADGNWVLPGFIDLHCHGGMGCDVMDGTLSDIETIARYHALGGTTAFLPTTASSSLEKILRALDVIHRARSTDLAGASVIGAHIEGPFFAYSKRGCHLPIYVRNPRPEEYDKILEYSEDISSMTIAPELDGSEALIKSLVQNDIVASIGHSEATYSQVLKAIEWGASHVTHMYCAMSTIVKDGPARITGIVESTLLLDDLTTEIIADGKHLPPELMKLVIKAKGLDKVCVVTDAMRGAGMPPGVYTFGPKDGQEAVVQDNMAVMPDRTGYASSVVRMNDLVKTLIGAVGLSLVDAVKMATIVPAKIIGMENKLGSLEEGKNANIVIADENIDICMTIVNGKKV